MPPTRHPTPPPLPLAVINCMTMAICQRRGMPDLSGAGGYNDKCQLVL